MSRTWIVVVTLVGACALAGALLLLHGATDESSEKLRALTEPFRSNGDLSMGGRKRLPTGRAEFGVTVFPHGTPSGRTDRPALLILLNHSGS